MMRMTVVHRLFVYLLTIFSSGAHYSGEGGEWQSTTNWNHESRRPLSVLLATGFWPGHLYPITALGEELVKRGHNVTLCATVMEGSNLLPDLPESYGINFVSAGPDNLTQADYDDVMKGLQSFDWRSMKFISTAPPRTSLQVRTKVSEIINNYDILVSDFSVLPVGVYYAKLDVRSIIFSPVFPCVEATLARWLSGSSQTDDLSFLDRLLNMFVPHSLMINSAFGDTPSIDREFGRVAKVDDLYHYPGTRIPLIINSALGFEFSKRISSLTHYTGPVLMSSTPPLEESLARWMSTKGERSVIFIGMGSTGTMTEDRLEAIAKGVMATKFDTVWKLSMEGQAYLKSTKFNIDRRRIYISNFVPRQTLFKHPALAMTFLHCGLNGVQESLSNGLPIVCAPNFFDHFEVGARIQAASAGFALYSFTEAMMKRNEITSDLVTSVIKTVTENETYREHALKTKKIFEFAGGVERAADLVEFYSEVGYDHLIPAFAKYEWSWVQYYNVDVYCVLSLLGCFLFYFFYRSLKCCCKCFFFKAKKPKSD